MSLNSREAEIFRRLIQRTNELQARVERLEKSYYGLWVLTPQWLKNWLLKREFLPPIQSTAPIYMKWSHIDSVPDSTITVAWSLDKHGEQPREITEFGEAEGY